ncbi:hypothetical protein Gpo141_00002883 [Globisporangium polare]
MDDAQTPPPPQAPAQAVTAATAPPPSSPSDAPTQAQPQQQQSSPHRAEEPWRRDEVIHLLRAWRQVTVAASASGGASDEEKPSSAELKARIFAQFCAFYDGQQPRSLKSLMKTRKSLLRSFRFIMVFNQNEVIAKSMSTFGGSNWFALDDGEQRRIVQAHYKRKPFAYIDEDMFDAVEMIQETENPSSAAAATATAMAAAPEEDEEAEPSRRAPSPPATTAYSTRDQGLAHIDPGSSTTSSTEVAPTAAVPTTASLRARAPSPIPPPSNASNFTNASGKLTNAWTRSDILLLLRVWEDTFDDPRIQNEPVAVFDSCVHERFHELPTASPAQLYRSPIALKIKRYSLTKSYKFISEFNRNKFPRVGGDPVAVTGPADWFSLSKKQRNAVVQEHYKKTHFTHLDEDMLPAISRIIQKAKEFEPSTAKAVPGSASASKNTADPPPQRSPKPSNPSTPSNTASQDAAMEPDDWDRRETTLLIRAWRDTVDGLHHKFLPNQAQLSLNARVYQRFLVLSEGETSRQEHQVSAKRAMFANTYALITDFNQNSGPGDNALSGAPQGWFSMRKSERKARLAQAMRPCTDIDEAVYNALRRILQKDDQNARMEAFASSSFAAGTQAPVQAAPLRNIMPQPSPVYTAKGLNVWNQEEVLLLVRAWAAVAEEGPQTENEPLYAFNNRIYRKFFELSQGKTVRTDKALIAKRESVLNSYLFITDFNQNKVIVTPAGQRNDWFAVSPVDQRYIVKVYYKKVSFSYLDPEMVEIMDHIMALSNKKTPTATAVAKALPLSAAAHYEPEPSAVGASAIAPVSRATRPNGWTREELFHLLHAWRDVVESEPRQGARETFGGLNGRVYQRFLELSGGVSSKADSALRSKRQSLTTTFEFIMDFNRKNFLDWFSLKESDRKKHIVNANRLTHCCSNIEEDVFEALTAILGDKSHLKAGTRPSSAVFRQQRAPTADDDSGAVATGHEQDDDAEAVETASSTAGGSSPTADELDSSATPNMDALSSSSRLTPTIPSSPSSTQAERKRHLVANVLAHIGQQETTHHHGDHDADSRGGGMATRPHEHHQQQQQEPHRKKPKLESDIGLIASMFEAQTQHLASLLHQIKEERKLEHDERRMLLQKIQLDQDERQRDRDERAAEREHARREWEQMREERQLEREQDRLLMKALLAQKGEKENVEMTSQVSKQKPTSGDQVASTSDREPLSEK